METRKTARTYILIPVAIACIALTIYVLNSRHGHQTLEGIFGECILVELHTIGLADSFVVFDPDEIRQFTSNLDPRILGNAHLSHEGLPPTNAYGEVVFHLKSPEGKINQVGVVVEDDGTVTMVHGPISHLRLPMPSFHSAYKNAILKERSKTAEAPKIPKAYFGLVVYMNEEGATTYILRPPLSRVMPVDSEQLMRFSSVTDLAEAILGYGDSVTVFHGRLDDVRADDGTIARLDREDELTLERDYNIRIE